MRAKDAAEEELALGTSNGNRELGLGTSNGNCPRGHFPSLWAVREHKAANRLPNSKLQDKLATEIPNKVLTIKPFQLEKTSEMEVNQPLTH